MKKTLKGFIVFILFLSQVHAGEFLSPRRNLDQDYSLYLPRMNKSLRRSPLGISRLYNESNLPKATAWDSLDNLNKRFKVIHNIRFLKWNPSPKRLRRISWNYPDDGCYSRASMMMRLFFGLSMPLPNKVFAFGNLRVKTRNSPRGIAGWWYHVAPIVEVNGVKFVIDPSIELSRPLTLKEWLSKMGKPEKIKVAICGSGTYSPKDFCDKISNGQETRAERAQQIFLGKEWKRMVNLGRQSEL